MKNNLTLTIIAILLIAPLFGFLQSCKSEPIDKDYELAISAFKLGYIQGRIDQMTKQKNNEYAYSDIEIEQRTLEYIKDLRLDSAYYKFASLSKNSK